MRRTSVGLGWINALVWGASLVLVGVLVAQGKLAWSWEALTLYLDGTTTTPPERGLELEARALLQREGDAAEVRSLLDRSIAIDPNSASVYFLGDLLLREGDVAGAMRQYERYLAIDPTFLPAYERIANLHAAAGRDDDRRALLERGIAYFESNTPAFVPHPQPDVATVFNEKAAAVHHAYVNSAAHLRDLLAAPGPPG